MNQITIRAETALPKVTETNELLRSVANDLSGSEANESELTLNELFNRAVGNDTSDIKEIKL